MFLDPTKAQTLNVVRVSDAAGVVRAVSDVPNAPHAFAMVYHGKVGARAVRWSRRDEGGLRATRWSHRDKGGARAARCGGLIATRRCEGGAVVVTGARRRRDARDGRGLLSFGNPLAAVGRSGIRLAAVGGVGERHVASSRALLVTYLISSRASLLAGRSRGRVCGRRALQEHLFRCDDERAVASWVATLNALRQLYGGGDVAAAAAALDEGGGGRSPGSPPSPPSGGGDGDVDARREDGRGGADDGRGDGRGRGCDPRAPPLSPKPPQQEEKDACPSAPDKPRRRDGVRRPPPPPPLPLPRDERHPAASAPRWKSPQESAKPPPPRAATVAAVVTAAHAFASPHAAVVEARAAM